MIRITDNKKCTFWLVSLLMLLPSAASAGVYFMTKDDGKGGYTQDRPCFVDYPLYGACSAGKVPQTFCPTDNRYYRACVCESKYQYTSSNCTGGKVLGGGTCEGKYESCTCGSQYRYTSSNCTGGKVLGGNSCDGKYETCGCSSQYSQSCSSPLVGVGSSCDGKYGSCRCPSNYVTCNNGGAAGASSCNDGSGTKYSSCKNPPAPDPDPEPYTPPVPNCAVGGSTSCTGPTDPNECTHGVFGKCKTCEGVTKYRCNSGTYCPLGTEPPVSGKTCVSPISVHGKTCCAFNSDKITCAERGMVDSCPPGYSGTLVSTWELPVCYKDCKKI